MKDRENPAMSCADAEAVNAAFFDNLALHQVYVSNIESQSALPQPTLPLMQNYNRRVLFHRVTVRKPILGAGPWRKRRIYLAA